MDSPRRSISKRGVVLLGCTLFLLLTIALSLADRIPAQLELADTRGTAAVSAVEDRLDIDLADRDDIPWETSELAHLVGYFSGMVLLGLTFRRRFGAGEVAVALFALSIALELAQPLLSSHRRFQMADITINALGVMTGLAVVVTLRAWRMGQARAR